MRVGDKVKITDCSNERLIGKTCIIVDVYKEADYIITYKLRCRGRLIEGWFNRYQIAPIRSLGGSVS